MTRIMRTIATRNGNAFSKPRAEKRKSDVANTGVRRDPDAKVRA
jgi:hypothetical protein